MRFMEAVESFAADAAKTRKSLTVMRGADAEANIHESERGFYAIRPNASPQYVVALKECARFVDGIRKGIISSWKLEEAMSTSDFPILFGDIMSRQLLGNYAVVEPTYTKISTPFTLKDLRSKKFQMIDGGREQPEVIKEYGPYPELSFTESQYAITVGKYGRRFGLSLEMIINDDLNAFASRPSQLAIGCRMMEEFTVTSLWIDASGPHATFFTAGNGNKLASNAPLSHEAIEAMMILMSQQTDSDGNPIQIMGYELVVSPALEVKANKLMHALEIQNGDTTSATVGVIRTSNWLAGKFNLTVNPWIPLIATSANGNTTWAIFARSGSGRPALGYGKLAGRETPRLYMQKSDSISLSGGEVSEIDGSFENDAINYKNQHWFGAARFDPKMAYASNGSGVAD